MENEIDRIKAKKKKKWSGAKRIGNKLKKHIYPFIQTRSKKKRQNLKSIDLNSMFDGKFYGVLVNFSLSIFYAMLKWIYFNGLCIRKFATIT